MINPINVARNYAELTIPSVYSSALNVQQIVEKPKCEERKVEDVSPIEYKGLEYFVGKFLDVKV